MAAIMSVGMSPSLATSGPNRAWRPFSSQAHQATRTPPGVFRVEASDASDYVNAQDSAFNRRQSIAATLALAGSFAARVAQAAQPQQLAKDYYNSTAKIHSAIRDILNTEDLEDPGSQDKLAAFKTDSSSWVADYRRIVGPAQKSYSDTYGVITAMLGFFTTFGIGKKNFPQKLKTTQLQRLDRAEQALKREMGRDKSDYTTVSASSLG